MYIGQLKVGTDHPTGFPKKTFDLFFGSIKTKEQNYSNGDLQLVGGHLEISVPNFQTSREESNFHFCGLGNLISYYTHFLKFLFWATLSDEDGLDIGTINLVSSLCITNAHTKRHDNRARTQACSFCIEPSPNCRHQAVTDMTALSEMITVPGISIRPGTLSGGSTLAWNPLVIPCSVADRALPPHETHFCLW